MADIEFLIALLLAAGVLVRLADVVSIPYPIVLVVGGLGIGFVPGLPSVELGPEVVFLVFLPPLLYSAGFNASPRALRAEIRALFGLALGLVFATVAIVAVVAHALVPDLSWAAAVVLGAIVAPTDPVSAVATFGRIGVPERVKLLVEGESMINDGSALVIYRVAVGAATTGAFALDQATLDFFVSALGGVAVGLAIAWIAAQVISRQTDSSLAIAGSVLTAYAQYMVAEELLHVSGILAVVAGGLSAGWSAPKALSADARLSGRAFWGVMVFVLEALLFVLLGVQFPVVLEELEGEAALGGLDGLVVDALVVSLTVIVVRLVWVFLPTATYGETARERLVVGWSGMRGAVSLAAALGVSEAVEGRTEILFLTFGVILVTLVGQGTTLPLLLRALGIRGERPWTPDEALARLEASQNALDRLDELEDEGATEEQLRRLRELYRARFRQCMAVVSGDGDGRSAPEDTHLRYSDLRRDLISVERATLLGLRNEGRLTPDRMRTIERDLDLDEARLRT